MGPGPFPGIVLIHHAPDWDEWYSETTRKFADQGYAAISHNLFHRAGDSKPDEAAARRYLDRVKILDTMVGLAADGMTMICVTHEMGFARQVADRVIYMADGAIVEEGEPEAFFRNPTHLRTREFLGQILTLH